MTPRLRCLAGLAAFLASFWFTLEAARACACCSNRAQRYVAVEKLDDHRLGVIEQMTFAREAFVAEGADDHPAEVQRLGTRLRLAVTRTAQEMVLSFRGEQGEFSAVTLTIPATSPSSRSIREPRKRTPASAPASTRNGN
jgi:hypothetical protein